MGIENKRYNKTQVVTDRIIFLAIMLVAIGLRFYKLDHQSLWHDELFTLNQADPSVSWKEMVHLLSLDTHPPLYVIISRLSFMVFGYTEWAARFPAALSGVLSVAAMYQLGKELGNRRLGLIAATLACVNVFSIGFSQEGRDYTMLMLFAAMSYLYFIRSATERKLSNFAGFVIFTVLLPYTHYYGLLIIGAEGLTALLLLITQSNERKQLFYWFAGSFIAICICYIPWIPYMLIIPELDSFWIPMSPISFPLHYYYDFFGATLFMLPFLLILPIIYAFPLLKERSFFKHLLKNRQSLFFLLFVVCFLVGHGVPYLQSIIKRPVLASRYLIFFIPFYIIILAKGISLIRHRILLYIVLGLFVVTQLWNVIIERKLYSVAYKEQVREVTTFITKEGKSYPMIDEWMAWRHTYYLKKFGYSGRILNYNGSIWPSRHNKEWMVDSILSRSSNYNVDTFWIVTINEDLPLSPGKRTDLDTAFTLIKEAHYIRANALLFGRKR